MSAIEDRLDDIEVRLLSPMVTYKENATEDAPALVAALRAVLAVTEATHDIPGSIRAMTCGEIEAAIAAALEATR